MLLKKLKNTFCSSEPTFSRIYLLFCLFTRSFP